MKEAAAAAAARPPWDGSFDVESQNLSADERHWVGWREEQLEVLGKRPRAGELIVVLESRYHSGQGKQLVTQHDPAKYEGYAARLRAAVDELNARAGWRVADLVQVPREPTHWSKVLHGGDACRLGAFEIMASTLAAPPAAFAADGSATGGGGGGELTSHLLHSKLATRKWPSISRVEAALGRALRRCGSCRASLCGRLDARRRAAAAADESGRRGKESLEVPLEYREGGDGDGDGEEGGGGGEAAAVTLAASSARFCVLKVAATADTEALESPMQVWPDDDGSLVARPALRPTARPFLLKLVCEAATPPHAPLPSAELRVLASARRTARCTLPVEQCAKADAKGVIELRWEGHVEDILVDEGGTMRRIGAWGDALSATAEGLVKFAPVTVRVGPAAIAAAKNATFIPATTATEKAPAKATDEGSRSREGGTGAGEGDGAHPSGHRHRAARARRRRAPAPVAATPAPAPARLAAAGARAAAAAPSQSPRRRRRAGRRRRLSTRSTAAATARRRSLSRGAAARSASTASNVCSRVTASTTTRRALGCRRLSRSSAPPTRPRSSIPWRDTSRWRSSMASPCPTRPPPRRTRRQAHRPARRSAGVGAPGGRKSVAERLAEKHGLAPAAAPPVALEAAESFETTKQQRYSTMPTPVEPGESNPVTGRALSSLTTEEARCLLESLTASLFQEYYDFSKCEMKGSDLVQDDDATILYDLRMAGITIDAHRHRLVKHLRALRDSGVMPDLLKPRYAAAAAAPAAAPAAPAPAPARRPPRRPPPSARRRRARSGARRRRARRRSACVGSACVGAPRRRPQVGRRTTR